LAAFASECRIRGPPVNFNAEHNRLTGQIPDLSQAYNLQNMLTGPVPPVYLNSPPYGPNNPPYFLTFATLCPNPLDTTPSANDDIWNNVTIHTPWWTTPYPSNTCDDIFTAQFE
jgi:hypothetical protein